MQRALQAILAHGGADAVNSFTRFYLAILGQSPSISAPRSHRGDVPAKWFPVNLYAGSSGPERSRAVVIISAMRPTRELDGRYAIRERS